MAARTGPRSPAALTWAASAVGIAIVLFGLRGLLTEEPRGAGSALRWLVGAALAIDLLIVPVAAAVGWVGRRTVPDWAWPPLRAALLTSAVLVAFALPLITDQGGTPGNASVRPRPYGSGLALAVAATWAVAAVWAAVARSRAASTWQHAPDADRGGPARR